MTNTLDHISLDELPGTPLASYIASVEDEGKRFARAAAAGALDPPIAACPGWTMRDLVRHVGEIHLWAAANVAFPRSTWLNVADLSALRPFWPDLADRWPSDDELVDWYRSTHANLLDVLRTAPLDVPAFSFLPAPTPLVMWARRQASEIAIHRYDAEHARGFATSYRPAFAGDMIDELLSGFAPYYAVATDHRQVLRVVATDVREQWWVTIAPSGMATSRRGDGADLTATGTAADLCLALWNRTSGSNIEFVGDPGVFDVWRNSCRVEWSR